MVFSGQTTVRRQNMQTKDSLENRARHTRQQPPPRHACVCVCFSLRSSATHHASTVHFQSAGRVPMSAHPVKSGKKTMLPLYIHTVGAPARPAACRHGTTPTLTTMYSRELAIYRACTRKQSARGHAACGRAGAWRVAAADTEHARQVGMASPCGVPAKLPPARPA